MNRNSYDGYYDGPIIRNIRLVRDHHHGYGLSLVGQQPCYVDSVVPGGAAERSGLRPMDCLVAINGRDVRRWMHEDIIREIGTASGVLMLKIVENDDNFPNENDACDERFQERFRERCIVTSTPKYSTYLYREDCSSSDGDDDEGDDFYSHRPFYSSGINKINLNVDMHRDGKYCHTRKKDDFHCKANFNSIPKREVHKTVSSKLPLDKYTSTSYKGTPDVLNEKFTIKNEPERKTDKFFKNKFERIENSNIISNQSQSTRAFLPKSHVSSFSIKGLRKFSIEKENEHLMKKRDKIDINGGGDASKVHIEDCFANENYVLPYIKNHFSSTNYGNVDASNFKVLDDDDDSLQFVVFYVGSIDLPIFKSSYSDCATVAIKHLKSSKKKELVVLSISKKLKKIFLINMHNNIIAEFKAEAIKDCFYPNVNGDKTSFVLILSHSSEQVEQIKVNQPFACCHVFKIDLLLVSHSKHLNIANILKIRCKQDNKSETNCSQFPSNGSIPAKHVKHILAIEKNLNNLNVLTSLENSSSNSSDLSKTKSLEFKKTNSYNNNLPPKIHTTTFMNPATPNKFFKPRFPDPVENILKQDHVQCNKSALKEDCLELPERRCLTPNYVTHVVNSNNSCNGFAINTPANSSNKLNDTIFIENTEENTSLLHNRSICLSLGTILDDMSKMEKKKSGTEVVVNSTDQNNFSKSAIVDNYHQRLSYSSGAIDEINQTKSSRVEYWARSFDFLLEDHIGVKIFFEFLKKELCSENLIFWLKCNDYKKNCLNTNGMNDSEQKEVLMQSAQRIYNEHLCEHSEEQINVDYSVKRNVEDRLNQSSICADIFDDAQKHIYMLMKQDKYGRFKLSEIYAKCLENEKLGRPLYFSILNDDDDTECEQTVAKKCKKKTLRSGLMFRKLKSDVKKKENEKNMAGFFNFIRRASVDKSQALSQYSDINNIRKQSASLNKLPRHSLDTETMFSYLQTNLASTNVEKPEKRAENVMQQKDCPADVIEMISRIQSRTLENQRGNFSKQDLKLPEFLKDFSTNELSKKENLECNLKSDAFSKKYLTGIEREKVDQRHPDIAPSSNHLNEDRKYRMNLIDEKNDFLEDNKWDEWLEDVDRFVVESDAILPTNEEAEFFFLGGASPPPLTIIEKGCNFN